MQEELKKNAGDADPNREIADNTSDVEDIVVGDTEKNRNELAAAEEKIEELNNRVLRLQADFENFRRRTAQEKQQLSGFVAAGIIEKFLKVLDNFERAEESAEKTGDMESLLTGMKQIRRQFDAVFKEIGVEEIEAEGKKFDPNLHEAVMQAQDPQLEDEAVAMVLEKGYKFSDRVIRHSKVSVNVNK